MFARPRSPRPRGASGVALLAALFVLLAVSLLAVGIARIAFDGELSARAARDRQLALQVAEAALVDAERDIEGGANRASLRAAMFRQDGSSGFVAGCGREAHNLGLCAWIPGTTPAWKTVEAAASVPYGSYTGVAFPASPAGGPLPLAPPRYVIERLPAVVAGEDAGVQQRLFRVTAFAVGARAGTQVVLQSVYRSNSTVAGAP
ncbi:pilus assembly PilX family protein [Massilia sp. PWRC2]|uniref:pilus assembly PilX family protein n=1 Tax=Massilia sp. PWRC2 TaxID=2804626 RepID=UPI003CFAF090